jgi:hypothetical protein
MIRTRHSDTRLPSLWVALCLWGGAFWAPPFLCAHSGDTTIARLRLQNSPEVALEITVDRHQNPHLQGAEDLAVALGKVLRVHLPSGKNWLVGELSKPSFSVSAGYEHPSPVPLAHNGVEQTPDLTTLTWTWRPSETPVRFSVDSTSPHTVLFWSTGPEDTQPNPGWRVLIAGDSAPPIPLPLPPGGLNWSWKAITALGCAAAGLFLQMFLLWRRFRSKAVLPSGE